MQFEGQTFWITGASSGIGESLARAVSARGAAVILSGRRLSELERVASSLPTPPLILPFEATDFDILPEIVKTAQQWRGGIDVLVNNAGVSQRSLAVDTSFDVYRSLFEIDFFAPLRLTQLVIPEMISRRRGHVVAISSMAGKIGAPLRTGYSAAKHACMGYFDALRTELETSSGVDVTTVVPGFVRTRIAEQALTGDGSALGSTDDNIAGGMDPDEAAAVIVEGLLAGTREIIVAGEQERLALQMRTERPGDLFDFLAAEGARLMRARTEGGSGVSLGSFADPGGRLPSHEA